MDGYYRTLDILRGLQRRTLALRFTSGQLNCSAAEPCCLDGADRLRGGRCLDVLTDGTFVAGLLH